MKDEKDEIQKLYRREYARRMRKKRRAAGLTQHEIWCRAENWPLIKAFIEQLERNRSDEN